MNALNAFNNSAFSKKYRILGKAKIMSKLYKEMDEAEKNQCQEKIDWLATIGFELLPDQPTPRLIHKDLPGEIYDVYDLNPLALVKKIYDLGEETVNRIIDDNKER